MFQSARLTLTAWYLFIIMVISVLFSITIYSNVSRQIEGFIHMQNDRIRNFQNKPPFNTIPPPGFPPILSTEDLQNQKNQLTITLILINCGIFIVAGGSGYFLAGRTLRPIHLMIDEQNRFITDSSHELRTPIATMRAEMEQHLLEKQISDKDARLLIQSNLEELTSLQTLTNNLLKLTHIHSSSMASSIEIIPLHDVLLAAQKRVMILAKQKNIDITIDHCTQKIKGEKSSFTELFIILLDNAIKYSKKHTQIHISIRNINDRCEIHISDQGIGISKKDLPKIFDRFYRADTSRSQVEGFGLGLSIAKQIVETFNGHISAIINQDNGMTFIVSLPYMRS
jgi:two-component system, OmpR family, sensor histidine kinase CiaH